MTNAGLSAWVNRRPWDRWLRSAMPWPTQSVSECRSCLSLLTAWSMLLIRKEAAMRPFDYASPTTADQVPALLGKSWGEVEILAGGSDLLSLMKDEITTPKRLVNIKQVAGLHAITNEGGAAHLGTLVTLDRIAAAAQLQHKHTMLAAAAGE